MRVISSTLVYSAFQMTMSPTRIESENASCSPAKKLPSEDWAAMPATTENRPAEANTEVPATRARGKVMSMAAIPSSQIVTVVMRLRI